MHATSIEEINCGIPPHLLFKDLKNLPYSFFLDSSIRSNNLSRFSFIGCEPFLVFKSKRNSVSLEWNDGSVQKLDSNPFVALKELFLKFAVAINPDSADEIPFKFGAVGYFGYDMKDLVEKLPDISKDDIAIADCVICFYDTVLAIDHLKDKAYLASVKFDDITTGAKARLKMALSSETHDMEEESMRQSGDSLRSNISKSDYMNSVKSAKNYIKDGDIYQVNLSQRFEADLEADPYQIYLKLRYASPAAFASYLNFDDTVIMSSSPERFLMKRGSYIETRPIKGTAPRSSDPLADELNEISLRESYKDRAEHIMIVDLERNDLGRICEYGSVRPSEFIALEKYSTVFHLVSTVSGKLKEGMGPIDCLTATFPGGSITGAPKVRSMEVIEELEPVKRSIYTGALGYISFDGNMDTSIIIRTILVKGKKLYFQVGAGIVADSDPEREYYETLDKANGIMDALGINRQAIYA